MKVLLSFFSSKMAAKYLPDVLAWILTKALQYVFKKYPENVTKAKETIKEVSKAIETTSKSVEDGKVTVEELEKCKYLWKEVFSFF